MHCFSMLLWYYAFQGSILYADILLRKEPCHTIIARRYAPYLTRTQRQRQGDALFLTIFWLHAVFILFLGYLLPCEPQAQATPTRLLANYLPSSLHLLISAGLIRARMASVMVQYAFFSGAFLLIVLTLLDGAWPQLPQDKWFLWVLPTVSACLYYGLLIATGPLYGRRQHHARDQQRAFTTDCEQGL